MKSFKKALFIFRRDLRIHDNHGLMEALKQSEQVIPCFIFDPVQISAKNPYRSMNAIQFMVQSLRELNEQLKEKNSRLYFFYGNAIEIVSNLISSQKIDAVFVNRDYTPFSLKRDQALEKICIQRGCAFSSYNDLLLHEPDQVLTANGTPYSIFTAFYKKASLLPVQKPQKKVVGTFFHQRIAGSYGTEIFKKILSKSNKNIWVKGGRSEALKILTSIAKLNDYAKTRDYPDLPTSYLSAHLKFGTISIREAYWHILQTLGTSHPLLRQLYWRDFFTYVAYHSPFVFGQSFHEKYTKLPWQNNKKDFKAWCQGRTGFPIVDAGMRQLNQTGWMHNRVRMIVASFLVKDLHVDWQWGEKYFAQQLVDYDPAVNNGNWQWNASTGCDAQPYFRIFNPWLQQKKFDRECNYIKRWVPELKNVDPKIIHAWYNLKNYGIMGYPRPLVDHAKESSKTKLVYKNI